MKIIALKNIIHFLVNNAKNNDLRKYILKEKLKY